MTAATLADWTTPRPFALPDLGPGLEGERREAVGLVLFGSRSSGTARPAMGGFWWCGFPKLEEIEGLHPRCQNDPSGCRTTWDFKAITLRCTNGWMPTARRNVGIPWRL